MRGFILSYFALTVTVVVMLVLTMMIKYAENIPSLLPSQLQGRINAAYTHLMWEYKGVTVTAGSTDTEKGCAPALLLDLKSDPVDHLARPIIIYRCG